MVKRIMLFGNPGGGKSTIGSALVQRQSAFESNGSASGVTTKASEAQGNGVRITDTPGIDDRKHREAAVKHIESSLRKGGDTSLVFVALINRGGRVTEAEITSINAVLDSLSTHDHASIRWSIICNQVPSNFFEEFKGQDFLGNCWETCKFAPDKVFLFESVPAAEYKKDYLVSPSEQKAYLYPDLVHSVDWSQALETCPSMMIQPAKVQPIKVNKWKSQLEDTLKLMKAMQLEHTKAINKAKQDGRHVFGSRHHVTLRGRGPFGGHHHCLNPQCHFHHGYSMYHTIHNTPGCCARCSNCQQTSYDCELKRCTAT